MKRARQSKACIKGFGEIKGRHQCNTQQHECTRIHSHNRSTVARLRLHIALRHQNIS